MIRSSRERNRSCSPVSRRSRGRIWFLAKSFPDERITDQVCKESPFASPFSGKFDYVYIPLPDSKSMTWEFFTEDHLHLPSQSVVVVEAHAREEIEGAFNEEVRALVRDFLKAAGFNDLGA